MKTFNSDYLTSYRSIDLGLIPYFMLSHIKLVKTKILLTEGILMRVESIAECSLLEHSAILLTCIKR